MHDGKALQGGTSHNFGCDFAKAFGIQFLDSDNYDLIEVGEDVPANTDFGVRIAGDSMEPRFRDGQIVWVHQQQTVENGEIGIFLYNGDSYCKKFSSTEDGVQLISLNIHLYKHF